jgi:hypothetical protein
MPMSQEGMLQTLSQEKLASGQARSVPINPLAARGATVMLNLHLVERGPSSLMQLTATLAGWLDEDSAKKRMKVEAERMGDGQLFGRNDSSL